MKRNRFLRFVTFVTVACGVTIAALATREEGREVLSQVGGYIGKTFMDSCRAVGQIIENARGYEGSSGYPYDGGQGYTSGTGTGTGVGGYQQNGSYQNRGEYSHTH